jgi:choline dehydrogenase-like flavoprotein
VLIAPALATGRLTLVTGAMARKVTSDRHGRATGVAYVRKADGADLRVRARIVVVAASACETARLLLNSRGSRFPQGMANTGGAVGRHLTDTVAVTVSAFVPALVGTPATTAPGAIGGHVYLPWWLDGAALDFPRGYHVEVSGGVQPPGGAALTAASLHPTGGGWGSALKEEYRRHHGAVVRLSARGEMLPNARTYCELSPSLKDRWGIPALRFHWAPGEHERRQARHIAGTLRSLVEGMGGTLLSPLADDDAAGMNPGGSTSHEIGCVRMGADPAASAVDPWCRAHDVPNLFVADGSPFVSHPEKNPTWTIMALAWRTAEHIVRQRRAGAL